MIANHSVVQSVTVPLAERDNYLTHTRGLRSWLFTLDHKRIGVMYLVGILTSFLLGGVIALTHPRGTVDAGQGLLERGSLQRVLHAPRGDHDLSLLDPQHSGSPGEFLAAHHGGSEGRGLPPHEPG